MISTAQIDDIARMNRCRRILATVVEKVRGDDCFKRAPGRGGGAVIFHTAVGGIDIETMEIFLFLPTCATSRHFNGFKVGGYRETRYPDRHQSFRTQWRRGPQTRMRCRWRPRDWSRNDFSGTGR